MRNARDAGAPVRAANSLRRTVAELFDASPHTRIILTPGMLVGLRILLADLKVQRIATSVHEYYQKAHFPALDVREFDLQSFTRNVVRDRPDAVIVSVVSWQGVPLPVRQLFREIRRSLGVRAPILIADYAHAGAVGFPSVKNLGADIVCGDLCKWVISPDKYSNLGFCWFRTQALMIKARRTFASFFLSTDLQPTGLQARWINPDELQNVVEWIKKNKLKRSGLIRQHRANMEMATQLGRLLAINETPKSSILWLSDSRKSRLIPSVMKQNRLIWEPPQGGLRVVCRADFMTQDRGHQKSKSLHK